MLPASRPTTTRRRRHRRTQKAKATTEGNTVCGFVSFLSPMATSTIKEYRYTALHGGANGMCACGGRNGAAAPCCIVHVACACMLYVVVLIDLHRSPRRLHHHTCTRPTWQSCGWWSERFTGARDVRAECHGVSVQNYHAVRPIKRSARIDNCCGVLCIDFISRHTRHSLFPFTCTVPPLQSLTIHWIFYRRSQNFGEHTPRADMGARLLWTDTSW